MIVKAYWQLSTSALRFVSCSTRPTVCFGSHGQAPCWHGCDGSSIRDYGPSSPWSLRGALACWDTRTPMSLVLPRSISAGVSFCAPFPPRMLRRSQSEALFPSSSNGFASMAVVIRGCCVRSSMSFSMARRQTRLCVRRSTSVTTRFRCGYASSGPERRLRFSVVCQRRGSLTQVYVRSNATRCEPLATSVSFVKRKSVVHSATFQDLACS